MHKRGGPGLSFLLLDPLRPVSTSRRQSCFSLGCCLASCSCHTPKTYTAAQKNAIQTTQSDQENSLSQLRRTMLPDLLPVKQSRARNRPLPPGLLSCRHPSRSPYLQTAPHNHTTHRSPFLNMKCIVFAGLLASATAFIAPAPRVSVSVSLAGSEGGRVGGREGRRRGSFNQKAHTHTHIHTVYVHSSTVPLRDEDGPGEPGGLRH